ncbi:MAG: BrnT family toxin [Gallionella sp.]|nr:BrnT family toxin [Gallionella sp.]
MINLAKITGFDWDEGNTRKNEKHDVSMAESEQIFFNDPLLILADIKHSQAEERFHALGKTDEGRAIHITFTLRSGSAKIRIISARDMHKKERQFYEQTT